MNAVGLRWRISQFLQVPACGIFFRFDRLIHPTPIVEAFSTAEDGTVDAGEGELGMTSRLRPKGPFKFCL